MALYCAASSCWCWASLRDANSRSIHTLLPWEHPEEVRQNEGKMRQNEAKMRQIRDCYYDVFLGIYILTSASYPRGEVDVLSP